MAVTPTPPQESAATNIIEQRVRLMIGDLMINNSALMVQLEGCQKEIAELKERLAAQKPAEAA
jgi:hypothetical protein